MVQIINNKTYSQSTTCTLNLKNVSVEQVLNTIEAKTTYRFLYNKELVDVTRKVTVTGKNLEVSRILKEIFKGTDVNFSINGKQIVLSKAEVKPAQQTVKKITGLITDQKGELIIGASVLVKGTKEGTMTDLNGSFSMDIKDNSTLVISYIGYKSTEYNIGNQRNIHVKLEENAKALDEVVVIGYGIQRKKDLTGAVGVVDIKEMKKNLTPGIGQALQGQVAGVSVSTSGEPGTDADIRIRGVGSFSNVGPLYVIDGMILTGGQREFNNNDVESVQVLKDASATALYGARGANGVIIITTKKGKEGTPRIEFSTNYGMQQIAHKIDMMNSLQFLRANRQAYENAGMIWPGEPSQGQVLTNTDWQKEFFKTGNTQDYNLSVSGGNKDGNYLISGNVMSQDGVVVGPTYDRYALRVNSGMKKGIFSLGENILFSRTQTKPMIGSPFIDLCRMPPIIPVKEANGNWGTGSPAYQTYGTNPIGEQQIQNLVQTSNRVLGNVFAELEIIKDLKFKSNFGLEYHAWHDRKETTFDQVRYLDVSKYTNQLDDNRGDFTTLILENTLTYNKKIGKHAFDLLAGYTAQDTKYQSQYSTVHNVVPGFWVLSSGSTDMQMSGGDSEYAMLSMLGRINYSYADKYLFQANVRRDGSSRFGANYRYGVFPSASLGWRISEENFFAGAKKYIDDLKFRASYGTIGDQQAIGDYDYATYITTGDGGVFGSNQALSPGAIQKGRANPNLHWESKTTLNLGLDFTALQNKLYGSVEYFTAKSKDLLVQLPISWTQGTDITPWTNYGAINNKGFEATLGYKEQKSDFKYNVNLNLTTLKNTVLKLGDSFRYGGDDGVNRSEVGRSVGDFYVIKTAGIFQNWDEIYSDTHTSTDPVTGKSVTSMVQPNAKPGDIKYVDNNHDGKIDQNDRQYVGSPFPNFELGMQFSCEYKNFDFSMFVAGVFGNRIYNNTKYWLEKMDETSNMPADLVPWTQQNHSTTTPRAVIGPNDNTNPLSDRWIEKGDYVRLKNVQIGYNFPKKMLRATKFIDSCRLFTGVQNLLTITNYSGYDPEISGGDIFGKGNDNGHFPPVRSFNIGVQITL